MINFFQINFLINYFYKIFRSKNIFCLRYASLSEASPNEGISLMNFHRRNSL